MGEYSLQYPNGHWALSLNVYGVPTTFQRMMDIILQSHHTFANANLNDAVIHTEGWEEYLTHLQNVLSEFSRAALTTN